MAGKHILEGLIKWSAREYWTDCFEEVLEEHLLPASDETGLDIDEIISILGEELFMSTVWACAFEDFLTREFDDGENAIDDYLKRRGWKETASARAYIAALRHSTMSLYEVSDIIPGASFRARDLLRGGEPVLISERSLTRSINPWDRIAARIVQVGTKTQIGGGVLVFSHGTADNILEAWDTLEKLDVDERRKLVEDTFGEDVGDEAIAALSSSEMASASCSLFTTFWLVDVIDRVREPSIPDLRNTEGDELILCVARYPLAAGTTDVDIRNALETHDEFHMVDKTAWSWITRNKKTAPADRGEQPERSVNLETWSDDGSLVLGNVRLEDKAVVLSVNSRQRCDRGDALLSTILGSRIGRPSIETETVEQMMASRDIGEPRELDISEAETRAIIHDQMDRHYRSVLDEPVPALGELTPRAAVKTEGGRLKVVEWLKMMENSTAESARHNSAMASYDFGWLWKELGLAELRR